MKQLRISRHGKVRGSVLDDEEDEVDREFKLSPVADEDLFDADAAPGAGRIPAAASAAGRPVPETSWRFGGGARRKRLSLPSIRLYSSLDSPGACYGDEPPQPGDAAATKQLVTPDQAKNNESGRGKLKRPVHQALAARRSREFTRADTDFLPSMMLEYDEEISSWPT